MQAVTQQLTKKIFQAGIKTNVKKKKKMGLIIIKYIEKKEFKIRKYLKGMD